MNDEKWFFAIPQWRGVLSERAGGERVWESFVVAQLWTRGYALGVKRRVRVVSSSNSVGWFEVGAIVKGDGVCPQPDRSEP